MNTNELEDVIRAELRAEVRQAPAGAPTKAAVLQAVRELPAPEQDVRRLRHWTVPLLAAAAVVLVAVGLTVGARSLNSHRVGPAHKQSPAISTPELPTSAPADPTPTPSRSSPTSSPTPQDWYRGLSIGGLPHTPGLCPSDLPVVAAAGSVAATVVGESSPLWLVPVTCQGSTDASWPAPVEVFGYRPSGPVLLQTLAYSQGDHRSIEVRSASYADGVLTLTEAGYSPTDALCCRSLRYRQNFTWQPDGTQHGQFLAGPRVDTVAACTGAQLTVTTRDLSTQSGDGLGLLLEYSNTAAEPCELHGYPGASAVDAAGRPVVDAQRTASGFFGGLAGSAKAPPTVTLFLGGTASAVIEWSGSVLSPTIPCYQAAGLASTPPGTTATRRFGKPGRFCDLQVHPVVPLGSGRG